MPRLVWGCCALVALASCTPIRPLFAGEMDSGADSAAGDAGADGSSPDGGCNGSVPDLCNGVNDDCDSTTADGAEDPRVGMPCDGPDSDQCTEGTYDGCHGGILTCTDTSADSVETCNGMDDDCNSLIDDDPSDGTVYYPDADMDGSGDDTMATRFCPPGPPAGMNWVTRGGDCNDGDRNIRPGISDNCDGLDNDCNGTIDDRSTICGSPLCAIEHYGEHAYLFCSDQTTWSDAQTACMSHGYHLVIVDDMDEEAFLASGTTTLGRNAWIGLHAVGSEYVWEDGSPIGSYSNWGTGEPSVSDGCARLMRSGSTGPTSWVTASCTMAWAYLCEAP